MTVPIISSELQEHRLPARRTRWWIAISMAVSQLLITLVFCTAAHLSYAAWVWVNDTGLAVDVTLPDVLAVATLGATVMAWSGYVFMVLAFYLFGGHRLSWPKRAAINLGLLSPSIYLVMLWTAELPLSLAWADVAWIFMTAVSVLAAEATTQSLWAFQRAR